MKSLSLISSLLLTTNALKYSKSVVSITNRCGIGRSASIFSRFASSTTDPTVKEKLKVGLCQILVGQNKQENIKKASNLLDSVSSPALLVSEDEKP